MNFNCNEFGLRKSNLYEVLATTFSINEAQIELVPNTAAMGIRFIDNNTLIITPYSNTTTFLNIRNNGFVGLNFIESVYLYALAALKEDLSPIGLSIFPLEYYNYLDFNDHQIKFDILHDKIKKINLPYINEAWLSLFGRVIDEKLLVKKNQFEDTKIAQFKILVYYFLKQKESFQHYNRAENLALETIILATRLNVAKEKNNSQLITKIYNKIIDHFENIKRFGKNKNALQTIDLVGKYIKNLMD
jgi:hypothetical protein